MLMNIFIRICYVRYNRRHNIIFNLIASLVFLVRMTGRFRWIERTDEVNLSRMAHVALSNLIMILQSGSLAYTFLDGKGPILTWSGYQLLLFLSLAIDTLFRVCMFFWCFANSCCFQRVIQLVTPQVDV